MSTHDNDGHTAAVQHATAGAESWRSAVDNQQAAAADHSDWYAITGEVVDTLRSMAVLAATFASQVATYGRGRVMRDDEPGHDPAERLAIASSWAAQVQHDIDHAERTANRFWNEISHIAVEVDR